MNESASQSGAPPANASPAAEKGTGPSAGLIAAALVHGGMLGWALSQTGPLPPAMSLPFGGAMALTATLGLLVIFLIAAFASRGALSFVVVPAMVVAGVSAHAVSTVSDHGVVDGHILMGVLGFGALGAALNLSFGAASLAARMAPRWSELRLLQSLAFRLGVLGLVVALAVSAASDRLEPVAVLCAAVGMVAFGAAWSAVQHDRAHGPAMAELVSAVSLSLGAVWAASIVSGAKTAAATGGWSAAPEAMQLAWSGALPLVLSLLVALGPRVALVGLGVKGGSSTVLATAIGAITCIGLSQVVLVRSTQLMSWEGEATVSSQDQDTPRPEEASHATALENAEPILPAPPAPPSASARVEPEEAQPVVSDTEPDEDTLTLERAADQTRVTLQVKVDGPMLERDVRQGVGKSLDRVIRCYEESDLRGEPTELKLGLMIDEMGSVKQAEALDPGPTNSHFLTCVQLAFYRSGFSGPSRHTWLELSIHFVPTA